MRLIGILITVVVISLLFVWWVNLAANNTKKTLSDTQNLVGTSSAQESGNIGPIDYSKQKVEEINKKTIENGNKINNYP